jgi:hypothetical protein
MKRFFAFCSIAMFATSIFINAAVNKDTSIVAGSTKYKLMTVIPNDYNKSKKYSLVVALQPCGWDIQTYRGSLKSLTDSLKIIVVCPYVNQLQLTNWGIVKASIDSARSIYNIDTASVYLTGMSCNGDYVLQTGLKNLFPFKGIFPWAPFVSTANPNLYNFNSKVPVVLSIGTQDSQYEVVLAIYDSLKKHKANVNLIIEQGVAHDITYSDQANMLVRCIYYLNDTNTISLSSPTDVAMMSNESKDVVVKFQNKSKNKIKFKTQTSVSNYLPNPEITSINNDSIVLRISKAITASKKYYIIIEATDSLGTSIEQTTFHVNVTKFVDVKKVNNNHLFEIYPNPTSDLLNVRNIEVGSTLQIYDITGNEILSKVINSTTDVLNIANFSKGIYLVKVTGKKVNGTMRLVVK